MNNHIIYAKAEVLMKLVDGKYPHSPKYPLKTVHEDCWVNIFNNSIIISTEAADGVTNHKVISLSDVTEFNLIPNK